jgi:hypothetical protein
MKRTQSAADKLLNQMAKMKPHLPAEIFGQVRLGPSTKNRPHTQCTQAGKSFSVSLSELIAKLFARLAADKLNQQPPSHQLLVVGLIIAFLPIH